MIRRVRVYFARRRLERLVARQRATFETQDFARRRKAALRHVPRGWA